MKRLIILFFIVFVSGIIKAQDTTVIQTLTFSDINKRRGLYVFPDSTVDYRKVIMSYTLKCDAATTWDSYACGEWDYLTYAFLYDHTGNYDSTLTSHPWFKKGTLAPDSVYLLSSAIHDYYFTTQYQIVYDAINSETDFTLGNGNTVINAPFISSNHRAKSQFFWKGSELTSQGLTSGTIDRIRFDVSSLGSSITNLKIRMRLTATSVFTNFDNSSTGWTTVFFSPLNFSSTGINSIDFQTPFNWNGSSNIIIEFSYDNNANGIDHILTADTLTFNTGVISDTLSKKYMDFTGDKYIDVNTNSFSSISDEVTISFWMYGDPNFQPENGTIFEGGNSLNQRVLNAHLPWSNGRVYWDAGVDEAGYYDRIDKAANTSDYEGKWNHWAFTKNATTGQMKIYLNGILWHSGTGKTKTMEGVDIFTIGGNFARTYGYHGKIDEFCIFNKELSNSDITNWMNKSIDPSHPNYSNLLYYFSFEENGGSYCENKINPAVSAYGLGMPVRREYLPSEIIQVKSTTTIRPKITFVRGDYDSHLDSITILDSLEHEVTSLVFYQVNGNYATPYDTIFGYEPSYSFEYTNGIKTDSNYISGGTLNVNDTLIFYAPPTEILDQYEIGRFITPYGINLSLGPNGFEWRYDITDYANFLHDTVDLSAGNTQELIDLKFILIEGTPPADVIQVDQLWNKGVASYTYANLDNDLNLSANTITLNSSTNEIKLKSRLTGHGHNSNTGNYPHCCEWKDNTHYLFANGNQIADWHIWRDDCAENPVFPQGGTWPGQREGWCPGDVVYEKEFRLTPYVSAGQITLDYDITPVPSSNLGMGAGNYVTAMHLIEYGTPNFSLDAEIYDIVRPNDWEYVSRKNPICYGPKIIIRNNGSTVLTSLTINYQVSGGMMETYNWTGSLEFLEQEEINLPIPNGVFWVGNGANNFIVTISNPNGGTDQYADNDTYISHFNLPDLYADNFVVNYKTNNLPNQNSWMIKDVAGNVVMSRSGGSANTVYNDTLNLPYGCYTFEMMDTGEDGLSYWANSSQGSGYVRFRAKTSSTLLKNFGADFGKSIFYPFVIGDITHIQNTGKEVFAEIYPNPSNGKFNFTVSGFTGNVHLHINDQNGKLIKSLAFNSDESSKFEIDLSGVINGIYYYTLEGENSFYSNKLVILK